MFSPFSPRRHPPHFNNEPSRPAGFLSAPSRVSRGGGCMKKLLLIALIFAAGTAAASNIGGFGMNVLTGDEMRPEYSARGKVYVEAVRGADYSIRLTNPTPYRVAVAL